MLFDGWLLTPVLRPSFLAFEQPEPDTPLTEAFFRFITKLRRSSSYAAKFRNYYFFARTGLAKNGNALL